MEVVARDSLAKLNSGGLACNKLVRVVYPAAWPGSVPGDRRGMERGRGQPGRAGKLPSPSGAHGVAAWEGLP